MKYVIKNFISEVLTKYKNDQTFRHSLNQTMSDFQCLTFYNVLTKKYTMFDPLGDTVLIDILDPVIAGLVSHLNTEEQKVIVTAVCAISLRESMRGIYYTTENEYKYLLTYILKLYRVKIRHNEMRRLILNNYSQLTKSYDINPSDYHISDEPTKQMLYDVECFAREHDETTIIDDDRVIKLSKKLAFKYKDIYDGIDHSTLVTTQILFNLLSIRAILDPYTVISFNNNISGFLMRKFIKVNTRYISEKM